MTPQTQSYRGRPFRASLPGQTTLTYFTAAFFALTLLTDWAYVQTMILMWRDFSSWLLFAGMVSGGVAVFLWLLSLAVYRQRPVWGEVLLNALILIVALVNNLIHAGDGWVSIMPWGLGLSLVTAALMVISGTLRRLAYPMQRA